MLLLLLMPLLCSGYKVLVYNPRFAFAHTKFMGNLADTLVEEGFDVTVLLNDIDNRLPYNGTTKGKLIHVPACNESAENIRKATDNEFCKAIWGLSARNFLVLNALKDAIADIYAPQCKYLLSQEKLIAQLKAENFDVAITETWDVCGLGLFHVLGIKSTIIGSSMAMLESTSQAIGAPLFPSFVPGSMSPVSDEMSFFERIENAINVFFSLQLFRNTESIIHSIFTRKYGHFPDFQELQRKAQLVFTNSVPLFDFPRLTLRKVLDLGGITHKEPKPLDDEWTAVLSNGPAILLSFGSVAKSIHMPEEYKTNLIQVIKSFPKVTFIWKHENPVDERLLSIDNLIASNWLPQNDLLGHPNLTGFITHGGANSVTESAFNGKPMIVVPVFADQTRMGFMAQERGIGILLAKNQLANFEVLKDAVHRLIYDDSLKSASNRFLELHKAADHNPRKLLSNHVNLLAQFKSLPELQPQSAEMSTFVLYSFDIISFFISLVMFIILVIAYCTKRVFKVLANVKAKVE